MLRMIDASELAAEIEKAEFSFQDEKELQAGVAEFVGNVLGFPVTRELQLTPRDRVDLYVGDPDCIGIEVKIAGSRDAVLRQVQRYTESELIRSIIVVTARTQLANLPTSLGGKPIHTASLIRSVL